MTSDKTADEMLAEYLPTLDEVLADRHEPLHSRPFEAACIFVREIIVEVSNGTKEKFLEQPWFTAVYKDVRAWYVQKYGSAMAAPRDPLRAVVLIGGVSFEVLVPKTTSKVEVKDETSWLTFPSGVEDGEEPSAWIVKPPNLRQF